MPFYTSESKTYIIITHAIPAIIHLIYYKISTSSLDGIGCGDFIILKIRCYFYVNVPIYFFILLESSSIYTRFTVGKVEYIKWNGNHEKNIGERKIKKRCKSEKESENTRVNSKWKKQMDRNEKDKDNQNEKDNEKEIKRKKFVRIDLYFWKSELLQWYYTVGEITEKIPIIKCVVSAGTVCSCCIYILIWGKV